MEIDSKYKIKTCVLIYCLYLFALVPSYSHADTANFTVYPVTFNWVDATSGTSILGSAGNANQSVPIGFSFNFYGQTYTDVFVSSNGLMTFGAGSNSNINETLAPPSGAPDNLIAAYWDDFNPIINGEVFYLTEGAEPNRRLVVTWHEIVHFGTSTEHGTFQAILYEGTDEILLQYLDVDFDGTNFDNGASATVGIENNDASINLQYSYNTISSIDNNSALLFSDQPCEPSTALAILNVDSPKPTDIITVGNTKELKLTVTQCDAPLLNASVDVTLNDNSVIALADDGIGPDQTANDGIYTADWLVSNAGSETLIFHISDNNIDQTKNVTVDVIPLVDYTFRPTTLNWVNATSGTSILGNSSSAEITIPIGFDFFFYGSPFANVTISTEGLMTFNLNSLYESTLYVFSDNLNPNAGGEVFYLTDGTAPNRRLVVTWHEVFHDGTTSNPATFQAILHEGSNEILLQYLDTDFEGFDHDHGITATIGVENFDGSIEVIHSSNTNSLEDNSAILISDQLCDSATTGGFLFINSPLENTQTTVNDILELSLSVSQCSLPKTGLSVDVTLDDNTIITLSDDGILPDITASDGTYTANMQVKTAGNDTLVYHASDTNIDLTRSIDIFAVQDYASVPVTVNWVDISASGALALDSSTASFQTLPIGFNFSFYGLTYTDITVSADGFLNFGGGTLASSNTTIPNSGIPNNLIAVFWDDLNLANGGEVFYLTEGVAPNRRLIVQWHEVFHYGSSVNPATFQAILYEGSNDILLQYLDTDFNVAYFNHGVSATVGIENIDGSIGLQYSYNTANITNNTAVLISGEVCDAATALAILDIDSPSQDDNVTVTETVELKINVEQCNLPLLNATVDVTLNDNSVITLFDDGLSPDMTAGDGIYTGNWLVTTPGTENLSFHVSDANINQTSAISVNVIEFIDYKISPTTFDWVDATSGTSILGNTDNSFQSAQIGFNFSFYGNTYSSISIGSNGLMAFGGSNSDNNNQNIPDASPLNNIIAVYWDDLNPSAGGEVFYLTDGTAPNRRMVIQWHDVLHKNVTSNPITFQAILYEGSNDIVIQYFDTDFGNSNFDHGASATVGVENITGTIGVKHRYNTTNSTSNNSAILISDQICDLATAPAFLFTESPSQNTTHNIDDIVELRLSIAQCSAIPSNVTVDATLSSDNTVIALTDDGVDPDQVANDGTFTADWQVTTANTETLTFNARNNDFDQTRDVTLTIVPNYSINLAAINWIDATSGTSILGNTGNDFQTIPIGFNFNFYGLLYTEINISSNGLLTFGTGSATAVNQTVPHVNVPNNLIAAYWDDLNPIIGGEVFYLTDGIAPNRRLIIQWHEVLHYATSTDPATFQAILFEGSDYIVLQYLDTDFDGTTYDYGASATIGIENIDGSDGVQYSYNTANSIDDNSALFITSLSVTADSDGDGLSDIFEFSIGTDSTLIDSDNDGVDDYTEIAWDGDDTSYTAGQDLNPLLADSDGDGTSDGDEVLGGSDPLNAASHPHTGDLNDDTSVDTVDLILLRQIVLGLTVPTPLQAIRGDVAPLTNGKPQPNDILNTGDLQVLQRKVLGEISF